MTPLWNWETRLPVHHTAMPTPSRCGVGTARPHGRGCCGLVAARQHHPGPIKAKTPAIVLGQGLSSLIKAYQGIRQKTSFLWNFSQVWRLEFEVTSSHPLCDFATSRLCVKTSASSHNQAPIKAENPCNRASSSLIKANVKFSLAHVSTLRLPVRPIQRVGWPYEGQFEITAFALICLDYARLKGFLP